MGTFGVAFTKQSQISERDKHYYPLTVLEKVSHLTFINAVLCQALTNVSNSDWDKETNRYAQYCVHNKRAQPDSPEASFMNDDEGNFVI